MKNPHVFVTKTTYKESLPYLQSCFHCEYYINNNNKNILESPSVPASTAGGRAERCRGVEVRLGAGHGSLLWYKTKHHLFTSGVSSLCRDSVCVQALFSCPYVMGRASEKNGETRIKDKRRVELKEEVNIVKTKEDSIYFVARERIGIFYPWLSALIILRIMYSGRNMYNLQI